MYKKILRPTCTNTSTANTVSLPGLVRRLLGIAGATRSFPQLQLDAFIVLPMNEIQVILNHKGTKRRSSYPYLQPKSKFLNAKPDAAGRCSVQMIISRLAADLKPSCILGFRVASTNFLLLSQSGARVKRLSEASNIFAIGKALVQMLNPQP